MFLGSVVYKVLIKLLPIRIQVFLLDIIIPNQIGFMARKSILDIMFLAQKAMEWTMERKQRLVLLILDFEKVFDHVNWDCFLALCSIVFYDIWIRWVSTLDKLVTSSIRVNEEIGESFNLSFQFDKDAHCHRVYSSLLLMCLITYYVTQHMGSMDLHYQVVMFLGTNHLHMTQHYIKKNTDDNLKKTNKMFFLLCITTKCKGQLEENLNDLGI